MRRSSRFIGALKTVDEDVTGPPVQTYNIATVMRRGYEHAAVLALIAVFVFVFADFRNLRDTALATVPLLFGGAWMLEAMGCMGWEFNLANLFAVPILIGTGVDNGVNMLYRWREERDKSALILTKAVGKSVTICSLTTIAGFAALIPAEHRGISSLGLGAEPRRHADPGRDAGGAARAVRAGGTANRKPPRRAAAGRRPKRNRRRRPRRPRAACAADRATVPLASGNRLFRLGHAVRAAAVRAQLARGVERLVPVDPSQEHALLAQAR